MINNVGRLQCWAAHTKTSPATFGHVNHQHHHVDDLNASNDGPGGMGHTHIN